MKERKKIIFSTYDDIHNPFYGGGGALAIQQITLGLSSSFDITVITGNYKGAQNKIVDNVFYKRIGPTFLGPKTSQLIFYFLLPFYVKKELFDIWIESFTPPFSTSCLQLFTRKPVIGLVHMLSGRDMERKYKLPFQFFEKKGLTTYKYFIVLQESIKQRIEIINKKAQIFVIPNGVKTVKQTKGQKTKDYIVFMGRLEFNQKGLDLLVDAYHTIASKITTKLIIAGSGSVNDEALLQKRIRKYGLENKIGLIGKVNGVEKDILFRNCRLVVIPSRYETFSLVALEALSYGKPIVSFAIRGLDWLSSRCAKKVKPFDIQQFGEMMYTVLHNTKLQQKMSTAGISVSKQYNWEKIIEQYKKIFTEVIS